MEYVIIRVKYQMARKHARRIVAFAELTLFSLSFFSCELVDGGMVDGVCTLDCTNVCQNRQLIL